MTIDELKKENAENTKKLKEFFKSRGVYRRKPTPPKERVVIVESRPLEQKIFPKYPICKGGGTVWHGMKITEGK